MKLPIFLTFAAALPLQAATVSIFASADATLYGPPSELMADGAGDWFFAGVNADGNIRRALLAFNPSVIPSAATISSVELRLVADRGRLFPSPIFAHRVTASWNEGITNANGREGQGSPAQPGDVTWAFRDEGGTPWTTPGGDFDPAVAGSGMITGVGPVTLSGSGMISDVQSWLNQPAGNHGWLLRGVEYLNQPANRIISRTNTAVSSRPVLSVTYTVVPEPGILSLLTMAAAPMLMRRVRH